MSVRRVPLDLPKFAADLIPVTLFFFVPFAVASWFAFTGRKIGSEKTVQVVLKAKLAASAFLVVLPGVCVERACRAYDLLDSKPIESYSHVLFYSATFVACILAAVGGLLVTYAERRKLVVLSVIGFLVALLSLAPVSNVKILETTQIALQKERVIALKNALAAIPPTDENLGRIRPLLISSYEALGGNPPAYLATLEAYKNYIADVEVCVASLPKSGAKLNLPLEPSMSPLGSVACAAVISDQGAAGLRFSISPLGLLRDMLPSRSEGFQGLRTRPLIQALTGKLPASIRAARPSAVGT